MFGVSARRLSAVCVVVALMLLFVPVANAKALAGARPVSQPSASAMGAAWTWLQGLLGLRVTTRPASRAHTQAAASGTGSTTGSGTGHKVPETGACIDPNGGCFGF